MTYREFSILMDMTYPFLASNQMTNMISGDVLDRRQVGSHRHAQEVVALLLGAELGPEVTRVDGGVLADLVVAVCHI